MASPGGDPIDLDTLYGLVGWWPSSPSEHGAQERLQRLRVTISTLLEKLGVLEALKARGNLHILDVMAGGCVAGAAAASVLAERGTRVRLLCVDARSVVEEAPGWLSLLPEAARGRVEIGFRRGDATRLPRLLGEGELWDLALLWGSPLPHLSPHRLLLLLAGLRGLQPRHGVVLVEQNNIGPKMLVYKYFKEVLVEGRALFIYQHWDAVNGMAVRLVYELPGMKYLGVDRIRPWDVADVAAQVAVFYENVSMHPATDYARVWVVAGVGPRSGAPSWRDLLGTVERLEQGSV